MPNSNLGGNGHSTLPSSDHNSGVWYDDDTVIPYLTRFRAKQCKTLDHADLARWTKAPVVR